MIFLIKLKGNQKIKKIKAGKLSDIIKKEAKNIDSIEKIIFTESYKIINNNLFSKKNLADMLRKFSLLLSANKSIDKVLDILISDKDEYNDIYISLKMLIMQGFSFSDAISKIDILDKISLFSIKMGERNSILSKTLYNLSEKYEEEYSNKKKIQSSLIYPIILSLTALSFFICLITFILPTMLNLFDSFDATIPFTLSFLVFIGESIKDYYYIYLSGILFLLFIIFLLKKNKNINVYMDEIKASMKNSKFIIKHNITLLESIKLTLDAGYNIYDSLKFLSDNYDNIFIQKDINILVANLDNGMQFKEAISRSKIFTKMTKGMLGIAYETGNLRDICDNLSNFYSQNLSIRIKKNIAVIEPAIIISIGLIVALLILLIAKPMLTSINNIF